MKESDELNQYRPHKKATYVVMAVILTAAVSGYFMGLQQTGSTIRERQSDSVVPSQGTRRDSSKDNSRMIKGGSNGPPTAPSYSEMAASDRGPNADWENDLRKLTRKKPNLFKQVEPSAQARQAVVEARRKLRAFDGAPPVIPHPINQTSSAACLSCHNENTEIKDRLAQKVPHKTYQSCTQCHVPTTTDAPPMAGDTMTANWPTNRFVGWTNQLEGKQAYSGGPPTIPHTTLMRKNCLSCHGAKARLRTTHPWRQSCLQCHAPSAGLDQHRFLSEPFPVSPKTRSQ